MKVGLNNLITEPRSFSEYDEDNEQQKYEIQMGKDELEDVN